MLNRLKQMKLHYEQLSEKIASPEVMADMNAWRELVKEHSTLEPIITAYDEYLETERGIADCRAMLDSEETEQEMRTLAEEELAELSHKAAQQQENLGGVAINPFTDNLIFKMPLVLRIQAVEKKRRELAKQGGEPKKKTLQLTPEQYLQFERRQFEFGFLPKRFFEQGQAFMDELCEKKEEYIDQLFEEAYQEKRRYPYLPEDFSVMVMNIAEDLLIVRVDLPAQDMAAPSFLRIYLAWNEVAGSGRYLTIETVKDSKERKLGELTLDWKKVDHGVAPVEGAELQYVIDLLQDKLS